MLDISDFNDFDIFSVVAAEGSLRRAAARLGLSQPLVSQRLTRLEKELDRKLVVRSTSGIRLTEAGARLVPHLRGVVRLMNEALASARAAAAASALTIWSDASLAPVVVPFAVRALADLPLELSNHVAPSDDAIRAVADGDADVAFGRRTVIDDEVSAERLFDDEICVVVHEAHPLSGRTEIGVDDLVPHRVAVAAGPSGWRLATDHLLVAGVAPTRLQHVEPANVALALATALRHVAVLPRSAVVHAPAFASLRELAVRELPRWRFEIDLLFRTVDEDRPAVHTLRRAVRAAREGDVVLGGARARSGRR